MDKLKELASRELRPYVRPTVCAHDGCGRPIEFDGLGFVHSDRARHLVDPGDDYRAQMAERRAIVMARVELRQRAEATS